MVGVVIGSNSMIAAGTILLPGTEVPGGQLWGGNPGAYMRDLTPEDLTTLQEVTIIFQSCNSILLTI